MVLLYEYVYSRYGKNTGNVYLHMRYSVIQKQKVGKESVGPEDIFRVSYLLILDP
jgi:hypothetical protein